MNGKSGTLRAWLAGISLAIVITAGLACAGEDDQPGFATGTPPTETPTESPTATPTPAETPIVLDLKGDKSGKRGDMKAAGPVNAEPYRVYTGDGDCLNVRPTPGTKFQSDPRTCVPEGFLLWLYGDSIDVDGITWRYALGEGWVAAQYVRPDPASRDTLAGRTPATTLVTVDGVEYHFSEIDSSGKVTPLSTLPMSQPISFHGAGKATYAVVSQYDPAPAVVFVRLSDGQQTSVAKAQFFAWSDDGKALLQLNRNGSELAYVIPGQQPVVLGPAPSNMSGVAWAPGGKSVFVSSEGASLYEFRVDSSSPRLVLPRDESRAYLGELSVSPDGTRVMSSPFLGALQVLSLSNGSVREFQRAPQQQNLKGRCGGASGKLSVWLDDRTIVWHESYAEKGFNGITIGNLDTGTRTLVPFFTLQDIHRVDSKTLSFTTQEYFEIGTTNESFPVTWILDIVSGEARPIAVGAQSMRPGV